MNAGDSYEFYVTLARDPGTKQTVASVPALGIADYGIDSEEALLRLREMLAFYLECLLAEDKAIPH